MVDIEEEAPMLIGTRAKSAADDFARNNYLQRTLELSGTPKDGKKPFKNLREQ